MKKGIGIFYQKYLTKDSKRGANLKVFVAKKKTIIFTSVSLCIFMFLVAIVTFVSPKAYKNNLSPLVIIDPGHGGEDGGAVGKNGTVEKDVNLKISLGLRDILHLFGYETVMTREKDKAIYDEEAIKLRQKKRSDLKNRLSIIHKNSGEDSIFISIHQNKFPNEKYSGTQIFYSSNNPNSENLALKVRENIVLNLQKSNKREIKESKSGIFLLKNSNIPSIVVECGFLSNEEEEKKLSDKLYQKKMSLCTFFGINDFFKI